MITKENIVQGLKDGVVRLEVNSKVGSALFHVGPNWFYFGEPTDAMNLDEYLENVPMEDIVDGIYDILESCLTHDRMKDVYRLCEILLVGSAEISASATSNPSGTTSHICDECRFCVFMNQEDGIPAMECLNPQAVDRYRSWVSGDSVCEQFMQRQKSMPTDSGSN